MKNWKILIPTILVASSIPMVSMVGCGGKELGAEKKLVQFNTMGGSFIAAEQVEAGTVINPPADPEKDDYEFGGWYDNESCTGNKHDFSKPVDNDITIYAKWTGGPTEYHKIQFTGEGISIPTEAVEDGKLAVKPEDPIKADYEFGGWYYEEQEEEIAFNWSTQIHKDFTLYPHWSPEGLDYTVTLEADDILDLNNGGGKLGQHYEGFIAVSNNYVGKYDVPNAHNYFDVTINGEEYEDFSVETIGADSNYKVKFLIPEQDLHKGDNITIKPNVKIEHYLKFTALEDGAQIGFEERGVPGPYLLQYCDDLDNPGWKDWDKNKLITLSSGDSIYVRNTQPKLSLSVDNYVSFYGDNDGKKIAVSGNVMSLLNFQKLYANCFVYLFFDNNIVTTPFLPSVILADNCYKEMFEGCEFLTSASELPATKLAKSCYYEMFYGCGALEIAADSLPADELPDHCCEGMFEDCISLIKAPEIQATKVGVNCCQLMFDDCDSLVDAPEVLPAKTLADYCYQGMFDSCNALRSAPKLPATTLAPYCYENMFTNCNSLPAAPKLPATVLAENCYHFMFYYCTSLKVRQKDIKTTENRFVFTCPDPVVKPSAVENMFVGCVCTDFNATPTPGKSYYWYTE